MATVPRNHTRKIADIRRRLTRARVFTLGNFFLGEFLDAEHAWAALYRHPHARLTVHDAGGRAVVHVHSNLWYELTAPGRLADVDAGGYQVSGETGTCNGR